MAHTFISPNGICNMALSHIGAASVQDFLTEQNARAAELRTWYDYSRLMALAKYDYGFARRRLTAALHGDAISDTSTDPLAGVWAYRYQYPADCVKMRKVQNPNAPPDDAVPFEIETSLDGEERTVLTDMEDAVFVYTRDQSNTVLYPPLFVLALSRLIASHVVFSLTGHRTIQEKQFELYLGIAALAESADANESVDAPPREAEAIRARA